MIYHRTVWATDKNIGAAYNREMALLPSDDDYCCFLDGDAMFTTPFFGKQLEDIVRINSDCGLFTCMTNRVSCKWQLDDFVDWNTDDMVTHRRIGEAFCVARYEDVEDVTHKQLLSGVLMLIRKREWRSVGGFQNGMLGVDNAIHKAFKDNGLKVLLMRGFYVYHWYRGGDGNNKKHLTK